MFTYRIAFQSAAAQFTGQIRHVFKSGKWNVKGHKIVLSFL